MPVLVEAAGISISDIDLFVNGQKESGSIEIKPGETLKVKVTIENTFSESTNIELEDIEVEATLEDIDDGDDMEEEDEIDDLDADDDDTVTLEFVIPDDADADDYDLKIKATGKANGTTYTDTDSVDVEVEREEHKVEIRSYALSATKLKCNRETNLDVFVKNIGTNDESVTLTVESSGLNYRKSDAFTLTDNPRDDDSEYRNSYSISVSKNIQAGVYPLFVRISYSQRSDEKRLDLTVEDCGTQTTATAQQPAQTQAASTTQTSLQPAAATTTPSAPSVISQVPVFEEEGLSKTLLIGLIAGGAAVIALIGIFSYNYYRNKPSKPPVQKL